MVEGLIKDYYSSGEFQNASSIFKKRCRENNCILKGNLEDYIILDGDEIEKYVSRSKRKSTDCILIDKVADCEGNVDVILCELCKGSKDFIEVREKITASAEHIVCVISRIGLKIKTLKCCYLGKYGDYNMALKLISKPIHIHGFDNYDVLIENFSCGTNIETLKKG